MVFENSLMSVFFDEVVLTIEVLRWTQDLILYVCLISYDDL